MSTESNLEERYIVFKLGDLHRYCSNFDISSIESVWQIIAKGRALEDKRPFRAVVIEDDLPEYEQIWNAIEARVTGAQPAPSMPDLLESLRCACNYIDKLGGVSQQYRAMLASAPEAKP